MGYQVVYFANASIPSRSANSVHVMKMCEGMGLEGHHVTLLVPNCGMAGDESAFSLYGVSECFKLRKIAWMRKSPVGFRNYLLTAYAALYIKFIAKPDFVVTRNPLASVLFPLSRIRTIVEFHKPLENRRVIGRMAAAFDIFRNRHLLKLVVISRSLRDEFAVKSCPREKIQVLADAASPCRPSEASGPPRKEGRLRVGYVGSLYNGRGIEIILGVAGLDPSSDYWIVGGGPEELARWKNAEDVPANVSFYGHVPNREVPAVLAGMDILLMPYQRSVAVSGNSDDTAKWMSPMKMFEYMATGKPIIASDLEVLKDVLVDGENCLLAPPEDVAAWHAAVERLKAEPDTSERIGTKGKRDLLENYTWEIRARKMFHDLPSARK